METLQTSLKSFLLELYLKPVLLTIGLYQIIVAGTFTAQQILLAAYLDILGYITISGIVLAIYFLFWFIFGPICGALSDQYGRKFLLISANWVSAIGFLGFILSPAPVLLFFFNALLGIGTSLRIGSVIALWVQNSPQERIGEAMAYINILMGIGGIGGTILGIGLWINIRELVFLIFGVLLFITAIPIIFVDDSGVYNPFSVSSVLESIRKIVSEKSNNFFFISKPVIQLSIHWMAFSAIVSFGTFIIPIFDRVLELLPSETEFSLLLLGFILIAFVISLFGGVLIWGRVSDRWARKPVLIIGYIGLSSLIIMIFSLIQIENFLYRFIMGLESYDFLSILILGIFLVLLFTAVGIIPAPMAWIIDLIGNENVAKAMSLRQGLIAIGTIVGTIVGGFVIGIFGLIGLILVTFFFLVISAIILL